MLRTGDLDHFEYKLKQLLADVGGGGPIFANVMSKSSNIGTDEAIDYLNYVVEGGGLARAKADDVIELLERSSRFR